ncbi:hypothetical protein [Microscilla marina]|uniref:Uncharacterized protein n=1 Tax=Microscilla marina ATCC 23134 TaxID=313606 RepID=A1ZU79_MICM2|nr:hypothetical protein [Microscilla marina]EAY26050.1 hypothetical protein M23134_06399 [Microscilla marina ATCC 23134]
MKNFTLSIFRRSIPYIKELRQLSGGVTSSLLMQQLDYYFSYHPKGFYKFMCPSRHAHYRNGDSWTEELGFSVREFRSAWQKIGVTYNSKSEFQQFKGDTFQGKFYCAYIDRKDHNKTYYFRNHKLLDERLFELAKTNSNFSQTTGSNQAQDDMLCGADDKNAFGAHDDMLHGVNNKLLCGVDNISSCAQGGMLQNVTSADNNLSSHEVTKAHITIGTIDNTYITSEKTKEKKEKFPSPSSSLNFYENEKKEECVSEQIKVSSIQATKSPSKVAKKVSQNTEMNREEFGQQVKILVTDLIREFEHIDIQWERERIEKILFERYFNDGLTPDYMAEQLKNYLLYIDFSGSFKFGTAENFIYQGLRSDYTKKLHSVQKQNNKRVANKNEQVIVAKTIQRNVPESDEDRYQKQYYENMKQQNLANK